MVIAVILAAAVGLNCWTANKSVQLGEIVAAHSTQIVLDATRIDNIEKYGSKTLEAFTASENVQNADIKERLGKLESAVIVLQSTPGELKALGVQLDSLKDAIQRVERNTTKPQLSSRYTGSTNYFEQ